MKKEFPNKNVDVALITLSTMDIGVRTLSSVLKKAGHTVVLGFFESWNMGSVEETQSIVQWIRETDPRIIGISAAEFSRAKVIKLVSVLKKEGKTIIVGGVDATLNHERYLEYADYAIRGEGECALLEFVDAELKGKEKGHIQNVCYKRADGTIIANAERPQITDLDSIPHEDLLDLEHHFELHDGRVRQKQGFVLNMEYDKFKGKGLFLVTLRGCIFKCSFCSNHKINQNGVPVRKRSVASVVERVAQLKAADPSINIIYFFDDDFFLRDEEELELFAKEWVSKVDLPFYVYCAPVTLKENKLKHLVNAGLLVVNMGIQTGSERTNFGVYNRRMGNESVIESATMLQHYAGTGRRELLPPIYDFIINSPYEKQEDLLETIRLLHKLPKPYFTFMHSLVLFQGTKLHDKAINDGYVTGEDTSAKYHYNDTLKHFDGLVKRGGNYYLNSLIYWMNGYHTKGRYGIVPAKMLGLLTWKGTIWMFNRNPWLISFLNYVLPTNRRVSNIEQKFKRYLSRHLDTVAGVIVRTNEAALSEQRH
jgi:radical SAM superfamily enzyme YgiQ (UPF0313 family)